MQGTPLIEREDTQTHFGGLPSCAFASLPLHDKMHGTATSLMIPPSPSVVPNPLRPLPSSNEGTDPPDSNRTAPCAVKECWIDPTDPNTSSEETMDAIGHELQKQYETLQPKSVVLCFFFPASVPASPSRRLLLACLKGLRIEQQQTHTRPRDPPPPLGLEAWLKHADYLTRVQAHELEFARRRVENMEGILDAAVILRISFRFSGTSYIKHLE